MKRRGRYSIIPWVSMGFIFLAILLVVFQLVTYSRLRNSFPLGTMIAGVPVGGLNQKRAADRLTQAYGVPVELHYGDAVIQVKPNTIGFEMNLETMLTAADQQRTDSPFWPGFWNYLWNRLPKPPEIPLTSKISEQRLRSYLTSEIATRYDHLPQASIPVAGGTTFQAGLSGSVLDIDRAVTLISDALKSPSARVVNLTFSRVGAPKPSLKNLQILLQQVIDVSGFDGLTEIFMTDLQTGNVVKFAYQQGKDVQSGIAFTAASTMKIPIMISTLRQVKEPIPVEITNMLVQMIERSENDPADRLMETVLDKNLGPLQMTEDMHMLGLQNTFMAGYFYPGAPLLKKIATPANTRTDVNTDPDVYNQTTPAEMGTLMVDLYECAKAGGGALAAAFPEQMTQGKCQTMISYLAANRIAVLLEEGLPDGTKIAHKHGWITSNDGLIHTMGDTGIIFTPGGDYVLAIYMYHPVQLLFNPANALFGNLSAAVYNYFNLK